MKRLDELIGLCKSASFFLKNNEIIAFNKEFKNLCPQIKDYKDFKTIFNFDYNLIADLTQTRQIVKNEHKNFYLNFIKIDKKEADYLVSVELVEKKSKKINLFKDFFRLGYLIIDLDKDNNVIEIHMPKLFLENFNLKNEISFIKKFISEKEIKKFKTEIYNLYKEKKSYFNFNTKINDEKNNEFYIQLRCFANSSCEKKQLLCTTLEYSDLNELQANLANTELTLLELYENVIDPIIIIDREKIISYNDAAKNISDLYNIDLKNNLSLTLLPKKYKKFLYNKKNIKRRIEDSFLLANGKRVYFEYTIIPIIIKDKDLYTIIFKDTTKTQELIEKLQTSENRYNEILNSVFDGIVLTDNMIIEFWNKSAEKITGYSKEEVTGKAIYSIFQEYQGLQTHEDLKEYMENLPKEFSIQKKILTKQGKEIIIALTTTTYIDSKGKRKSVGIFQDITEKYLADEEIKRQKEELKEVNAALKNFFSILAHDMRTPVIQMLGLTELLLENYNDFSIEEQKKFLTMLQQSSKNGLELLDTVVEWGRTMTNKIIIEPEYFNIDEVIEKVIRLNSSQSTSKNITVNYLPQELYVFADSKMIFTVLNNLISNAIKFSYKNSEIIIRTESLEEEIRISVQDFGKGIKETENIFLYNKKNIELGTENEKGKGIGLMFSAELIKKNNGKIWFDSKLNQGSTFYFTLPKQKK